MLTLPIETPPPRVGAGRARGRAPAPVPAPPKKDGAKEPVPDDPVKRARSTVDAALHLLDASVAV